MSGHRNQRYADRLFNLNKVRGVLDVGVRQTIKPRTCHSEQCPDGGMIRKNSRYVRVRHEGLIEGNPVFHIDCYRWEYTV